MTTNDHKWPQMTTNGYSDIAEDDDDETDNEITKLWHDGQLGEVLTYIPRGIGEWKTAGNLEERMQFLGKGPFFNTLGCWLLTGCPPLETTFLDRTVVSQSGDSHFMAETRKTTLETKVTLKSTFKCRATGFALKFIIMWD